MKYAIVIPDGCADEPQASLGGRTPLEAANVPNMDAIAAAGVVGAASHVPASLPPGSDVANLSLFGYDPLDYFTGRAPLEAAASLFVVSNDLGHCEVILRLGVTRFWPDAVPATDDRCCVGCGLTVPT